MWSVFKEFLRFCAREKKWWLIPLIVVLLLLGVILIFSASLRHRVGAVSVHVIYARVAEYSRHLRLLP